MAKIKRISICKAADFFEYQKRNKGMDKDEEPDRDGDIR